MPDAYFEPDDQFREWTGRKRNVDHIRAMLDGLDMELAMTFEVPKEHCADEAVLRKTGAALATAKVGAPVFRIRSSAARQVAAAVWDKLPAAGFGSRERVGAAVRDRFCVDGGAECALGRLRLAYPKVGARIVRPVTRAEAERAVDNCGVRVDHLPRHAVAPYPLIASGSAGIQVNPRSDNGYPVLAKWSTPGASEKALGLAVSVRKELTKRMFIPGGIAQWYAEAQDSTPWLVACKGKAKGDYYASAKIQAGALRFYNALPRQVMLNMQVATQPLEAVSRSVLEGTHSGIGMSLVRGGAHELVAVLEQQLEARGAAYVHLGDDSWVVVRAGSELVWFALDCSNFDLTQHADATLEVHAALQRQLRCVDAAAADLWYEYARQRIVVVAGAVVRRFKHAGPSGMPLQSKVNDLLMDVLINRVLEVAPDWRVESAVDAAIAAVGQELGFSVRVEQYACMRADTLLEALEQTPFLFVGYYFHVRGGKAMVCADIPRTLAQMPYPGLKWMKTDREVEVMEAMRLGSILLSAGLPTRELEPAFEAWRQSAVGLLEAALQKYGEQQAEGLRWAVGETPWGPEVIPSLRGLRSALRADPRDLWLMPEPELPVISDLVLGDWADEVEAMERQSHAGPEQYVPPPAAPYPPAPVVRRPTPPTHPVTAANDGRPPPTARWGPPKPARGVRVRVARTRTQVRRTRGPLQQESDDDWWSQGGGSSCEVSYEG